MQVFPPTSAPQGPVADQRTQSPGAEECADATDGADPWAAFGAWPGAHRGMSPTLQYSFQHCRPQGY